MNNNLVDSFIEVGLKQPDDFLKIVETLTRIGIASNKEKKLWQSCHILHKRGKYYIVHFKELFMLDGKPTDFTEEDAARRNTIANMLHGWGLLDLVDPSKSVTPAVEPFKVKVLQFSEKSEWNLIPKYSIGNRKS